MNLEHVLIVLLALALGACGADSTESQNLAGADPAIVESSVNETGDTDGLCLASGPQAPRDIALPTGRNPISFPLAPESDQMNLCNIHTHTNAEHRGP